MIQFDPIQPVTIRPSIQGHAVAFPQSNDPIRESFLGWQNQNLPQLSNPFGLLAQNGISSPGAMSGFLSLIPALGSLFANIYNIQQQKKMLQDQKEWQKEFYDYTFNKQREEYWKQQEYNNPANQILRLTAAGLNPNLMYGSGSAVNAGNAQALNPAGESGRFTPTVPYFDSDSLITSLLTPLQAFSQMHLNNAKSVEALENAGLSKSNAIKIGLLTPLEQQRMQGEISNLAAKYHEIQANIIKTHADAKNQTIYNQIAAKMYAAQLSLIRQQKTLFYEQANLSIAQQEKCWNEVYTILPALKNSYNADAAVKWANAKQITQLLPHNLKHAAANAGISEKEFNNYFWTHILPAYFGSTVGAAGTVGSAAIKAAAM